MDNYLPELVDALVSRMDPQQVCAISGLCNNALIDRMLDDRIVIHSAPSRTQPEALPQIQLNCPTCVKYINETMQYLKHNTGNVQTLLLKECGYLGSYSDACRKVVIEEFDQIEDMLTRADDPKRFL